MPRPIEIRCPIYGFIFLNAWEHELISHPSFQRLRRVRQLAWTDYVYPGAMHTRFEHSLGVMQMVSSLYDGVVSRSEDFLRDELNYSDEGFERFRQQLRLAALLHDVGHGPFSHAGEELLPITKDKKTGKERPFRHEEYSIAIIKRDFKTLIEQNSHNVNWGFKVEDITGLIEGGAAAGRAAIWQDLISGQLDGDRMDYLLRDSYHAGVEYGKYDWRRVASTVEIVPDFETETPRIGIAEGGRHAAEAMIIARYMMFNQVYFHKTRVILDHHLREALRTMLPNGKFPPPEGAGLDEFMKWNDWEVLGRLSRGEGGEHGARLVNRDFYRVVWETPEFPNDEDNAKLEEVEKRLGEMVSAKCEAGKSWYKVGPADLPVKTSTEVRPLSLSSTIVQNMKPSRLTRLYVREENRDKARQIIEKFQSEGKR